MKNKILHILVMLFFISLQTVGGQTLDPSFNAKFLYTGTVNDIYVQSDGKMLVAGYFHFANDQLSQGIARINEDGTTDTSFNPGTGTDGSILAVSTQSDGKILVGGNFNRFNGELHNNIVRLNSDGSVDPTFDVGTGPNQYGYIHCLREDNEGRVLVGGSFETFSDVTAIGLVRLNSDGSMDPNFVLNTITFSNAQVKDLEFQSSNKIIIMNDAGTYLDNTNELLRLNTDGSLDTTFQSDLDFGVGISLSVNVLPDDKIVFPATHNVSGGESGIFFLSENGDEENFYSIGDVDEIFRDVASDENGNIYFGDDYIYHFNTVTNEMETIPTTDPFEGWIIAMAIHPDGTLLVGGRLSSFGDSPQASFVKFDEQIQFDSDFNAKITSPGIVNSILLMDDGKLLVGGNFFLVNGEKAFNLVRLNSDGSIDHTFEQDQYTSSGGVYKLALSSDGKIFAGGFKNFITSLFKFNMDGSLASDFNFTAGVGPGFVQEIYESPAGDIYLSASGYFGAGFNIPGIGTNRIAKINSQGFVYSNFPSQLTGFSLDHILFESDGKLTVSGADIGLGSDGPFRVVRLNSNYSVDNTFEAIDNVNNNNSGTNNYGRIYDILKLDNGKSLMVGNFSLLDSLEVSSGIVRVDEEGLIDSSFDTGTGFTLLGEDSDLKGIQKIGSDRYIVHGEMDQFKGLDALGVAILDTDGMMVDCGFGISSGLVNDLIVVDSTSIYVAGEFILSSTQDLVSIAKYIDVCESVSTNHPKIDNSWVSINPNPAIDKVEVQMKLSEGSGRVLLTLRSLLGKVIQIEEDHIVNGQVSKTISINGLPTGSYILTVEFEDKTSIQKIIKL